ncbi:hypothetical protein AK830_g607 [Neonectria ditissima]|uniref:Uncharacterized protein n=1 Tax=Neonectria ditissima TaxID=78410 RepID=A0A0P7BWD4_9HYPO|nr:hypothetical protein AK830_g607 [Neonectria ditissima]
MAGLLLRRLVTPSRAKSKDEHDWDHIRESDDLSVAKKSSQRKERARSWMPSTKKKRSSTVPITIHRVHSIHRISNPLPHVFADISCNSSYTSLLSSEAKRDSIGWAPPPNRRAVSALCLPEQGQRHQHPSAPKRPVRPENELLDFPDEDVLFLQKRPTSTLSLSVTGADQTKSLFLRSQSPLSNKESLTVATKDVEHLILETEEAFKAVGTSLENVRPTSRTFELSATSATPAPLSLTHKHTQSMPLPLRYNRTPKSKCGLSPPPLAPPIRRASVKKPMRNKSIKKSSFGGSRRRRSLIPGPRWALSENMTGILTGQRFKRIEADEMLTSKQLEQLKINREQALIQKEKLSKARRSSDSTSSLRSENPDTPAEPFHLQDLPERIGAAGVKAATTFVEAAPSSVALDRDVDVIHEDFSLPSNGLRDDGNSDCLRRQLTDENEASNTDADSIPLLPPKNPARFGASPHHAPLSSVPEVLVTPPQKPLPKPPKKQRAQRVPSLKTEEKDGILHLKSTPFTLTKPLFRHGPITVSKTEVCQGVKAMDDTLDWTSFQMAILCGAGDLFQDLTQEEDAKQVDDITAWFGSFGFETHGQLISEDVPAPSLRGSTLSSTPSTVDMDMDLPIPVGSEYPSGFWNSPSSGPSTSKEKFYNNTGLKRWMGEGRPKRYTSRSSMDSPPLSPMLPLVVPAGDLHGGDTAEPVPMGFNLHHDLGDFLRWEAENVYATGFSDGGTTRDVNHSAMTNSALSPVPWEGGNPQSNQHMIILAAFALIGIVHILARMNPDRQPAPHRRDGAMHKPRLIENFLAEDGYGDVYEAHDAYEAECEAEYEALRTARITFGNTAGTTVTGYPSKGGTYALGGCTAVELAFLGVDRFAAAQREEEEEEEDAFCARMRQLGARWSGDGGAGPEPVLYVGWPAGGGVWAVRRSYRAGPLGKGLGRISNAVTMAERCAVIEQLGGVFYADPRECPDLDLDGTMEYEVKMGSAEAGMGEDGGGGDDGSFVLVVPDEMSAAKILHFALLIDRVVHDVAAYEDRRAREALVAAQQARIAAAAEAQANAASDAAGMDGVQASPDPEVRVRRARDDRIGVTRRAR